MAPKLQLPGSKVERKFELEERAGMGAESRGFACRRLLCLETGLWDLELRRTELAS
jgi:hypothetical protein